MRETSAQFKRLFMTLSPAAFAATLWLAIPGFAQFDLTTGRGQISAQYYDSPASEGIVNVIDHDSLTKYLTFHQTGWIQFQANALYVVTGYTITSANDLPERDPSTWTLEGSSDGTTWSPLDSRTNESFPGRFATQRYFFANTAPWSHYRLTMTSASDRLQIADWSLICAVSHDISATGITLSSTASGGASAPLVTVRNNGSNTESFAVACRIDSASIRIYDRTVNVTTLAPGQSQTVTFPSFTIAGKQYTITALTELANDLMPGNDTAEYYLMVGSFNPSYDSIVYAVAGAHLDDQWQWTLTSTIQNALPATMQNNFDLLNAYPEYEVSFEGAYRYALMKQYYPSSYDTLKSWVAKDRWHYVGTFWSSCDVLVPSAEALIRQALYGTEFSMDEFGKRSVDIYLPDCFGFGYNLPTIARHCGIIGFSTQKFDNWGGSFPTPYSIGRWTGPDGSTIVASHKPGSYVGGAEIRTADGDVLKATSGMWLTQDYIGTGDFGGSPSGVDVEAMVTRIRANGSNRIKMVCKSADQIFRDLSPSNIEALPAYDGEFLMTTHGTGCYTSWASMKLKNRRNEQRGAAAELACVTANWLSGGNFAYPIDTLSTAWKRFLACQFHDVVTGTSIVAAYDIAHPMEDSSYNDFNYAFGLGNNAVANGIGQQLTTTVSAAGRVPVVLCNPLAFDRVEAVQAVVSLGSGAHAGVRVYDQNGKEVPAQIIGSSGLTDTIVFIARIPSAGYAVFEAEALATANQPVNGLSITTSASGDTLQNDFYRVVVNANGDIASVYHKPTSQELLSAPSRLELRNNTGTDYPAWEVTYADVSAAPTGYVDQNVVTTVKENGPARVCLQVTRTKNGSTFTQYIALAADSAGARVDVGNAINWLTTGTLLKVAFPVTCSNAKAAWDIGIGTVQRPNMTTSLYEVPGQQWADMTSLAGTYGLSILTDCKYGWNKESDSKLNLTLIHSPTTTNFDYQNDQSNVNYVGTHRFTYSFYGHANGWTNGTVQQAASLNQPITAFQATPRNGALAARTISLVKPSTPQVMVMAIKRAQKSNYYIVRVREAAGASVTGAKLVFGANITQAVEMNGTEELITSPTPFTTSGTELTFDLTKYQPRTFALTLAGAPQLSVDPRTGNERLAVAGNMVSVSLGMKGNYSKVFFKLQPGELVRSIRIIDASGRVVRTLASSGTASKTLSFTWDGKNGSADQLGSGAYFICLTTNSSRMAQRLIHTGR